MTDAPTPSIDVVIPTFGRWDLTERCLSLLRAQTLPHTVVVVDNGSTDGTPVNIRASFSEVEVIELGENLGFPIACNRGAAAGKGDVLVLLNNDIEAPPEFLEQLVAPLIEPAVGTVAALLLRPGRQTIDSMGLCADSTLVGFPRLRGRPISEASATRPALAGPCGAAGAYRRAAWEDVGGLDEGVRFYGEDLDLALRIRQAGWRTVGASDAVALHLGSATAGNRSSWQRFQGGFARGYFLRRYRLMSTRAAPRALATETIVVVGDALISHDFSALSGRVAGWRAGGMVAPRSARPIAAVDESISFRESLRLRRAVYAS